MTHSSFENQLSDKGQLLLNRNLRKTKLVRSLFRVRAVVFHIAHFRGVHYLYMSCSLALTLTQIFVLFSPQADTFEW